MHQDSGLLLASAGWLAMNREHVRRLNFEVYKCPE